MTDAWEDLEAELDAEYEADHGPIKEADVTETLVDGSGDVVASETKPGFVIDSKGKADWAMRKYRLAVERLKENMAFYDEEMARLVRWKNKVDGDPARTARYMEAKLLDWFEAERATNPEIKSISLPNGSLVTNPAQSLTVTDEAAVLAFIQALPDEVREAVEAATVKHVPENWEIRAGELKKILLKDGKGRLRAALAQSPGEVIPGIELTENANEKIKL